MGREIQRLISTQVPVRKIGEQIADEVKILLLISIIYKNLHLNEINYIWLFLCR